MTEMPVWKLVIMLGIPTTISMLITNVYNMADTYFVSTLGKAAGGAPGIVFSIMAILQAFGFMFGHGAGSHVSRLLGAKDEERAGDFATTSLLLSAASGVFIMVFGLAFIGALSVICYGFASPIIGFFNSEKDLLINAIGTQALRFNCLVLWVLPFTVVGNMMFQSIGKRIPAILLSALQNGVAFIPMIYLLPYLCEKYFGDGLMGLEMAQPAAYVITAAITLPVTVIFLSKLPKDGEAAGKKI